MCDRSNQAEDPGAHTHFSLQNVQRLIAGVKSKHHTQNVTRGFHIQAGPPAATVPMSPPTLPLFTSLFPMSSLHGKETELQMTFFFTTTLAQLQ